MATEIKVPTLGESVTSATVARWMKHEGDSVAADEPLVELETDKVTVEVNAPAAGVLTSIAVPEGGEVEVGALLALLEAGAKAASAWCFGPSGCRRQRLRRHPRRQHLRRDRRRLPRRQLPRRSGRTGAGHGGACGGQSSSGGAPPPRPLGPVSRPAGAAGAATAGGGEADGRAACGAGTDRRRQRQGRADHQGRRAGVPEPPGAGPAPPRRPWRNRLGRTSRASNGCG